MNGADAEWRRALVTYGACVVLLAAVLRPAAAEPVAGGWTPRWRVLAVSADALTWCAPGLGGRIHRMITRAEHSAGRLAGTTERVAVLWLWLLWSAAVFLLVAAVTSVIDLRMFDFRRNSLEAVSRDLGYGTRTFFRIVLDRRTPYRARLILAAALLYWLLPMDFVRDSPVLPGFVDDLLVAVLAAKAFMYFCPDSLVALHATAVETRA
ncbi:MAG: DUF1232 domain-containing protein [Candidatus Binatia bacterium]